MHFYGIGPSEYRTLTVAEHNAMSRYMTKYAEAMRNG